MSMPLLNDELNFDDINLDFLEPPSTVIKSVVTTVASPNLVAAIPFNGQEHMQLNAQQQISNPRNSIQELSKRIAEVDALIHHVRQAQKERDDLRKNFEDYHQNVKDIQAIYATEVRKCAEEKQRNTELSERCESLDRDLTSRTLEVDQLKARLDSLKGPIEYDEIVIRYLKLIQKVDEMHWRDQSVVKALQNYCKDKCLKIPPSPIISRSPRKRKLFVAKVDVEIQCDIAEGEIAAKTEPENNAKRKNDTEPSTRDQGCQHVGTTTTRSTTTSCFIKYHDVGINCNILDFKYTLNDILSDVRSWSTPVKPLSPIAELDSICVNVAPIELLPPSPNCTKLEESLPPPNRLHNVECKTVGTCTFICNVQRHIDYAFQVPVIKRSNSRPPSTALYETIKDEISSQSIEPTTTSVAPSILNVLDDQTCTMPHLFSIAFDELWQIFGRMIYGLLERRSENTAPFTNETVVPNNITTKQDFYDWLQILYSDIQSGEHTRAQAQIPFSDGRVSLVEANREDAIPTENEEGRSCSVISPLNFSNEVPVKCTSSAQYLFKPKAQRTEDYFTDENLMEGYTRLNSIAASPMRCVITSPISSGTNGRSTSTKIEDSLEHNVKNRTLSAFTSPNAVNKGETKSEESPNFSETAEKILELFPSVSNRTTTLKSLEKLLHKNWKNSKKKLVEKRNSKRFSIKKKDENAVEFVTTLTTYQHSQNPKTVEYEEDLDSTKEQTQEKEESSEKAYLKNVLPKNSTVKRSKLATESEKSKNFIHELNRTLFGSETDDNDSDSPSDSSEKELKRDFPVTVKLLDCMENNTMVLDSNLFSNGESNGNLNQTNNKSQHLKDDIITSSLECGGFDILNNVYELDKKLSATSTSPQICMQKEKEVYDRKLNEEQSLYQETNKIEDIADFSKKLECNTKDSEMMQPSIEQYPMSANETERPTFFEKNFLFVQKLNETKQNNSYPSPKRRKSDTLLNVEDNHSHISDSSISSNESRLMIVSDNDEAVNLKSEPLIPKKRGRKRKSSSSSKVNLMDTVVENKSCKRSARLLAKRKLQEEQNTIHQKLPHLCPRKGNSPNSVEMGGFNLQHNNVEEDYTKERTCTEGQVTVLLYNANKKSVRTCSEDKKLNEHQEEMNEAVEYGHLTKNVLSKDSTQMTIAPNDSNAKVLNTYTEDRKLDEYPEENNQTITYKHLTKNSFSEDLTRTAIAPNGSFTEVLKTYPEDEKLDEQSEKNNESITYEHLTKNVLSEDSTQTPIAPNDSNAKILNTYTEDRKLDEYPKENNQTITYEHLTKNSFSEDSTRTTIAPNGSFTEVLKTYLEDEKHGEYSEKNNEVITYDHLTKNAFSEDLIQTHIAPNDSFIEILKTYPEDEKPNEHPENNNESITYEHLTKNLLSEDSMQIDIALNDSFTQVIFSSPPASPAISDSVGIEDQPVKDIPLERCEENFVSQLNRSLLYNLISNYEPRQYRSFYASQFTEHQKSEMSQLKEHFKEYLALSVESEPAAVQIVNLVLSLSQNLKIIALALCSSVGEESRPPTLPYEIVKNDESRPDTTPHEIIRNNETDILSRPIPDGIYRKMSPIVSQLINRQSEFKNVLPTVIDSILFSVLNADAISINAALNLTDLYLLVLVLEKTSLTENPARLFIAKCLYYHKVKAIPMIYAALSLFPTILPYREEEDYDRSDALITVIQHSLMCTKYNMDNHELFHRELLSKLRFAYHFEIYKPDFHAVVQNLLEKLRAGKLKNLKYAFAVFCKRLPPERVIREIIQPYMIPLSYEYYTLSTHSTEYDERTAALLDTFSSVIKPFPRGKLTPIAAEIKSYISLFQRFLSNIERPIVQEAAVHAILRLQRFSYINCYRALSKFWPNYELAPSTRAALRTFIHRKPFHFWKKLLTVDS